MLEILAHSNLPHELVLVSIHSGELSDVGEGELQSIGELEGVDVSESVLNVRVDDELGETENLSTEMEGVSESRLLSFLRRERLDGFQTVHRWSASMRRRRERCGSLHVVVEVEIIQILSMNEKIEHVVSLSTDLETGFDPIDLGGLEELGRFDCEREKSAKIRLDEMNSTDVDGRDASWAAASASSIEAC